MNATALELASPHSSTKAPVKKSTADH